MITETWNEPIKCAKFIERFTSHILGDFEISHLKDYTRNDLEGIIQLLHGFYTHFMLDNSIEVREKAKCYAEDVLTSMTLASSIQYKDGEIILSDDLWDLVKNSPQFLKFLICAEKS